MEEGRGKGSVVGKIRLNRENLSQDRRGQRIYNKLNQKVPILVFLLLETFMPTIYVSYIASK